MPTFLGNMPKRPLQEIIVMQKICFLALLSFFSFQALSQGTITGTVKDVKTGEAIIGANVVIQGTTIGSATDVEGNFLINNVKEGNVWLI